MNNRMKIIVISPFALILVLSLAAYSISFGSLSDTGAKGGFSEGERQMLAFMPADIASLKQRQRLQPSGALKSPMEFNSSDAGRGAYPPVALDALVPSAATSAGPSLSFVMIGEKKRVAIIKGAIVREGDRLDGLKVADIEPGRVLLQNSTSKWISLEKIK
jgi:hypothetical protein